MSRINENREKNCKVNEFVESLANFILTPHAYD